MPPDVPVDDPGELARRLDVIESITAVSSLPHRYAIALDARDLDTLVGLFVHDVDVGRRGTGRAALRDYFDTVLRRFGRSIHLVGPTAVELVDPDRATAVTYCRAEHEDGDRWFVMTLRYDDVAERRDGRWYFLRRKERLWYSTDVLERPGPDWVRWPPEAGLVADLPEALPTWTDFWSSSRGAD